jgi:GT2 family glycosyltransferase
VIAAVVLTFDARDGMLEASLEALRQHSPADLRIIVVDNGRATRELRHGALAGVEVVQPGSNLGFAGGMNVGIRLALTQRASAVAVLNDDVVVEAGWLEPLVSELDRDSAVGAAQPQLVYPGSPRRVNSMGVQLGRDGAGTDVGMGLLVDEMSADPHDIELFTGGAVLLRADFLRQVGMFDERYFLYYEDVDLGLRGRRLGWRYRCVPSSTVVHEGGATVARVGHRAAYLRERNRLWILLRYRPVGHIVRGLWLSIRRLRWPPRLVHLRALCAGTAAAPRLVWLRCVQRAP